MGKIGNAASSMDIEATANDRLLTQVTTQEQSVSGVNLDEEAANLLRYQQAYQAAAKLGAGQAAKLAAMLPNPRFYDRNRNAPYLLNRTGIILARMGDAQLP